MQYNDMPMDAGAGSSTGEPIRFGSDRVSTEAVANAPCAIERRAPTTSRARAQMVGGDESAMTSMLDNRVMPENTGDGDEPAIRKAAEVLRLAFGAEESPWSFRLWDGNIVDCHAQRSKTLVHFKSRDVFKRLFSKLDLLAFGEAYINSELDFEGCIFDVMERSCYLQVEQIPWKSKLKIWSLVRRI